MIKYLPFLQNNKLLKVHIIISSKKLICTSCSILTSVTVIGLWIPINNARCNQRDGSPHTAAVPDLTPRAECTVHRTYRGATLWNHIPAQTNKQNTRLRNFLTVLNKTIGFK